MTGGQQFNLRWNNHTNNLARVLYDQFEREEMVDVTLTCQGKFIKAHRMVLGACSPYFHDIFSTHATFPSSASSYPIVILNGFEFEDVQAIVEFMYKGEVMVCENVMPRMLKAAEGLQVKGLSNVRSKGTGNGGGSRQSLREDDDEEEEDEGLGCGVGGGDEESDEEAKLDGVKGLNNGVGLRRRSRDSGEFMSKVNAVPLHKRRNKRKLKPVVNVAEKKPNLLNLNNQSITQISAGSSSSTSSPASSFKHDKSDDFMDHGEDLDLLSAINIEPPLLRDIDGKFDNIWENNNGIKMSPGGKSPMENKVIHEPVATPLFSPEQKIPRPPNSFMIFANEWRRQLAGQHPNESNKEISVRLGLMWKDLTEEHKAKYFTAAKQANDDHKKKFPNYHYNPKEARMRKMFKMQQQAQQHLLANN